MVQHIKALHVLVHMRLHLFACESECDSVWLYYVHVAMSVLPVSFRCKCYYVCHTMLLNAVVCFEMALVLV